MNKLILSAAALAAGLMVSGAYAADSDHHHRGDRFKEMDANGDGKITRQEATDGAKAHFAELDKNGDGKVTAADFTGGEGHRDPSKFMSRVDTDGDGTITQKEWVDRALERFDRMDKNGDGTVTQEEAQAAADERGSH